MPILQELPTELSQTLAKHRNGTGDLPIHVAVQTDRLASGDFGSRWLVADANALRVYTSDKDGTKAGLDATIKLSEIVSVRDEPMVGGGSLLVKRKGGETIELLRYGASLAGDMAGAARMIDALVTGESLPVGEEFGTEKRVCPKCGRPLPSDNNVCKACLNQGATLSRLFTYATERRGLVVLLCVLMIAATAAGLVPGV
ncbi:MAG: zinc ribbon domain-containing protein, partial [Armatimonadetes bacterium]|nr:zinc ribbon domain-containing protein [Armatimonadota bacterium]